MGDLPDWQGLVAGERVRKSEPEASATVGKRLGQVPRADHHQRYRMIVFPDLDLHTTLADERLTRCWFRSAREISIALAIWFATSLIKMMVLVGAPP
jgi:hypothetical protein